MRLNKKILLFIIIIAVLGVLPFISSKKAAAGGLVRIIPYAFFPTWETLVVDGLTCWVDVIWVCTDAECQPGSWDSVNCRRCSPDGHWEAICADWGNGQTDPAAWCACELKCTGSTGCCTPSCEASYCGNTCSCTEGQTYWWSPDIVWWVGGDGNIYGSYCTPPTPVNGVCAATHYNCTAGNLGTWAEYTDSWQWWCNGIDGGSNTLCIETRTPVNGVCATTHYNCNAGTLGSVAEYADSWQWWCNGINGGGNILCTEVKTLFVSLSASPANGPAPLNDVVLTASVSGTVTGTINYKFDCTNDGTWDAEFDGTYDNPKTTSCSYPTIGTYTARVMVERGALPAAYGTALIRVSVPIPQWKEVAP